MKRKTYRNGQDITLPGGCDGCNPAMINAVLCHEHGCPDAWRDHHVECFECGCEFWPDHRSQQTCLDCIEGESEFQDHDFEEED